MTARRAAAGWMVERCWLVLLLAVRHTALVRAMDVEVSSAEHSKCAILDPLESSAWKYYSADGVDRWQFSYKIRVLNWCALPT